MRWMLLDTVENNGCLKLADELLPNYFQPKVRNTVKVPVVLLVKCQIFSLQSLGGLLMGYCQLQIFSSA